MPHPLPLTGERTLPGVPGEEYWFARHEAVYRWVAERFAAILRDGVVVEAGSGEGYGAAILRDAGARAVVALEHDEPAARHAAAAYPSVSTSRANLAAMPVAAASADLLVCLQVVEHLWDLRGFLADCVRVLRPGGVAVVSTPNRPVFSPASVGARGRRTPSTSRSSTPSSSTSACAPQASPTSTCSASGTARVSRRGSPCAARGSWPPRSPW